MSRTKALVLPLIASLSVCAIARGDDISNPNGMLTASTAADLDAAAVNGSLVLGRGMLKWTGGDAAWNSNVTLAMPSNTEVTVNVTDPNATLTLCGTISQPDSGSFIKLGPGTLELTGGGRLGRNYPWLASGYWGLLGKTENFFSNQDPYWDDATGYATNGGYTAFTVAEGTLCLNAPGKTFALAQLPWVGDRQQTSSQMVITNGTTVTSDGSWFTISRGAGQTMNDVTSVARVVDGSSFTVGNMCMGHPVGKPNYYCRSYLEIDRSQVTVNGQVFQPEHTGLAKISLTNASALFNLNQGAYNNGWEMRYDASTAVSGCSTVSIHQVGMQANVTLDVTDGSVFKLDRTVPSYYQASGVRSKRVRFDDATLMPYLSGGATEWFGGAGSGVTNFVVGANGMTVEVPTWSWLGAVPRAEAASSKIVKKGAGVFSMPYSTNAAPVELQEGSLAFDQPIRTWTNDWQKILTPPAGTGFFVSGEGALGGKTIMPAGDFSLTLADNGALKDSSSAWTCSQWAKVMPDGNSIALTVQGVESSGAAWRTTKVRVDEDFTITYDYSAFHTGSTAADYAAMLAFQTTSASACGGRTVNLGINYGTISNCWAIGLNLGDGIAYTASRRDPNAWNIDTLLIGTRDDRMGTPDEPTHCIFTYDATEKRAVFTAYCAKTGNILTRTVDVDLAAFLGTTTAWVGFTGSSSAAANTQHIVRNYRRTTESQSKPALMRTGGAVHLGAGAALTANLAANETVGSFALDALEASGAVTLDVTAKGTPPSVRALPVLNTLNHDLWTLSGHAFWTETGLAASTNASGAFGGAVTKYAYPATGSWNFAFDWSPGLPVPAHIADIYRVAIGNFNAVQSGTPSTGVMLYLQDWDNNIHQDVVYVKLYVKGALQSTQYYSTNTAETVTLNMKKDLHVNMAYDDDAKRITLDLTQDNGATAKQLVFENVDMDTALNGMERARLSVHSQVGGYQTQAIMSNLVWTGEAMSAALAPPKNRPALAFDKVSGATAITKTGDGDLAFLKPDGLATAVTLADGGLRFAKEPLDTVTVGAGGGWIFSGETGVYTATNGIKIGTNVSNNKDSANLRHRVRVTGDWRASFRLWNTIGADGISFYMHNDPRGNNVVGGHVQYAGYKGVQNSFAVGWANYTSPDSMTNKMGIAQNSEAISYSVPMAPVFIRKSSAIDVTIVHTAAAKTLDVTMVQDGNEFTYQWTNVDIPGSVKDDYAWLAVGTGGGGVHTFPYYDNFRFEQLDGADTLADGKYLTAIDVTAPTGYVTLDSPVTNGAFNVADGVSVAAGSTLHVVAANEDATLRTGTLTLGAGAALAGDGAVTIAPDAVAGDFSDLVVDGTVFAPSEADITAGTFAKRTVRLSNGAKLHIGAAKFMRVEDVYVDGVRQDAASVYTAANAEWITSTSLGRVGMRAGTILILR